MNPNSLTSQDVAEMIGRTRSRVNQMALRGELPPPSMVIVGKRNVQRFWSRKAIEKYLQSCKP